MGGDLGPGLRFLQVEDNPEDAKLVEMNLRKAGWQFILKKVETAPEFLAAFHDFKPDLVLSDYNLPRFGALEALSLIKAENFDVPLVIITGSLSPGVEEKCLAAGASACVFKDNLDPLSKALHRALYGQAGTVERRV